MFKNLSLNKFWIEKISFGLKKIILLVLITLLTSLISLKLSIFLLILLICSLLIVLYFYGYSYVSHEFRIKNILYRIVDFTNYKNNKRVRKILKNEDLVSAININDPLKNEYLSGIDKLIVRKNKNLEFLHIGGAGCSTPILLSNIIKNSKHTVIEIEKKMISISNKYFLNNKNKKMISQINIDAKKFVNQKNKNEYDYIIQDILMKKGTSDNYFLSEKWIKKVLGMLKKNGMLIINTSNRSSDLALNIILKLRNTKFKLEIEKINKVYLVIIKNE